MAGKRVAQGEPVQTMKKGSKAGWIALGIAAALVVSGVAGFCAYAGGYDKVFPGVTLGDKDLSGLTQQQLRQSVTPDELLSGQVTVTAGGEELGERTQRELGAYVDGGSLADAAWRVGREEGALGWLKNGWTMLRGLMGMDAPMELAVYYDDAVLRSAAAELAESFDQTPVDGSYELASDGVYATKPADGRALDQPGLIRALTALNGGTGTVDAPFEVIDRKSVV